MGLEGRIVKEGMKTEDLVTEERLVNTETGEATCQMISQREKRMQ